MLIYLSLAYWARRRELWNKELRRRAQRQLEIEWQEHNLKVWNHK